ncbi:alpha/beta hydrolase [Microbacterium sp. NPDC058389]|uniref:alpha/beta hydrolase n=1 Tax=Microbacterium sp. NPDC058389 TaxID=3346475 RepID=UPI003663E9B9
MGSILELPIIDGPVPWILYGLAAAIALYLLLRRPTVRWLVTAAIGLVGGAAIGAALYFLANASGAFGDPLPPEVLWWTMATLAAIGLAIVNLWHSRWWRKVIASVGIVVFALTGVVGVNAFYGLNPTIASLLGVVTDNPIVLPTGTPTATNGAPGKPLYETWKAPAGMPAKGTVGTQTIPATASGFDARPAGVYLPPAALGADAPALPVIVFMMGFPGNPDASYIAATLDEYAAKHNGLAPIAVVADQIGPSGNDPACADSRAYGNAQTYITKDVVAWIKANLKVIDDPRWWVIGGYSNGGGCAITYAATYPELWKNVIDISGEPFPGSEDADSVTQQVYGGDKNAFEASKPVNIMAAHPGAYRGMTAAFTAGAEDPTYMDAAKTVSQAASAAGMTVTNQTIPGAGHTGDALTSGLEITIGAMYPVLGLSAQ